MSAHFFVTGYPRSGTAWMATFLSGCPGVTCTHEALRHLDAIEELPEALRGPGLQGTADSALPFFLDEIEAIFPDASWVLLDREKTASREALTRFLGCPPAPGMYEAVRAPLERIREKALVVPFEELTRRHSVERVLRHIGYATRGEGGYPVWNRRWRHMRDLRVEIKREAYDNLKLDTPMARHILGLISKEAA